MRDFQLNNFLSNEEIKFLIDNLCLECLEVIYKCDYVIFL